MIAAPDVLLAAFDISKSFPGVRALDGVNLTCCERSCRRKEAERVTMRDQPPRDLGGYGRGSSQTAAPVP